MENMQRERDLVLSPNEYAFVLDKTKGLISCVVGSYKMSLSNSDSLVVFNERTKKFEETGFTEAITTFVTAPENWYIVLKNPAIDNKHPTAGTSNALPDLQIGKKINIQGNTSFALYPGQMARVIKGHTLKSNQYLLARVYDANVLDPDDPEAKRFMKTETVKEEGTDEEYTYSQEVTLNPEVGELFIIKGTETQFYMPPTGVEIIPVNYDGDRIYVRDAVTLEKLEYCILKNEEGEKKYIHGSAVVFPEPDEEFVKNDEGGYKFKAIELSDISGIYVKVVSDYEENGVKHKAGEELFITGKDQMIYYPRPEHAIISYEGKILHHAIAIPAGEGRYVLERNTGEIKTIKGSAMYLVNPIKEVVVKRKLTKKQCHLWYPGNQEVLRYNCPEEAVTIYSNSENLRGMSFSTAATASMDTLTPLDNGFYGQNKIETDNSGFARGNTYSKPRTITIDNKFEGVVAIDIWTGFAINVVSKSGDRKVIIGPQTYLLEYDETLESMALSTGKPKTTDHLLETVYLRVDNNKISDIIQATTEDFVSVSIKVSYSVDFLEQYKDKWFSVENYVKYLCDRMRSLVKREVKNYTIQEFYNNASDIVRNVILDIQEDTLTEDTEAANTSGRLFIENGMFIHDVDILSVKADSEVQELINENQMETIEKTLKLTTAKIALEVDKKRAETEQAEKELYYETQTKEADLKNKLELKKLAYEEAENRAKEEAALAAAKAKEELQSVLDAIKKAEIERSRADYDLEEYHTKQMNDLLSSKQTAYAKVIKTIMESISPDLIASMNASANAELMEVVTKSMSPYAIANGESVSDVANRLLRGTSLEGLIEQLSTVKEA